MNPLWLILIAAVGLGIFEISRRLVSSYVNPVFGAVAISLVATLLGGAFLIQGFRKGQLFTSSKGIWLLVLGGSAVFLVDYLVLKAYSKGLPVTVGSPILIGGSIAVVAVIGFLMGESITFYKVGGLVLIILGSVLLTSFK